MKYRKKPVVIDAVQWFPDKAVAGVFARPTGYPLEGQAHIETLEGPLAVSPGDWIITGVKGEKYPCKPDIFALTYEPVEASA